jgi:DNA-binding LacI/PurR family transcriptional regulator
MADHTTREKLQQLVDEGRFTTPTAAARELGVSRSRVSYILRHALVPRSDIKGRVLQMFHEGRLTSRTEAARELGVSRARVSTILSRAGLTSPQSRTKVVVVCPECGSTRLLKPSEARKLRSRLCRQCYLKPKRVTLVCPECGLRRDVYPSRAAVQPSGRCRECWKKRGPHA